MLKVHLCRTANSHQERWLAAECLECLDVPLASFFYFFFYLLESCTDEPVAIAA